MSRSVTTRRGTRSRNHSTKSSSGSTIACARATHRSASVDAAAAACKRASTIWRKSSRDSLAGTQISVKRLRMAGDSSFLP